MQLHDVWYMLWSQNNNLEPLKGNIQNDVCYRLAISIDWKCISVLEYGHTYDALDELRSPPSHSAKILRSCANIIPSKNRQCYRMSNDDNNFPIFPILPSSFYNTRNFLWQVVRVVNAKQDGVHHSIFLISLAAVG